MGTTPVTNQANQAVAPVMQVGTPMTNIAVQTVTEDNSRLYLMVLVFLAGVILGVLLKAYLFSSKVTGGGYSNTGMSGGGCHIPIS